VLFLFSTVFVVSLIFVRRWLATGQLGDICSTDDDCSIVIDHSVCDDVTMTCRCDVTAGYLPNVDGHCEIRECLCFAELRIVVTS